MSAENGPENPLPRLVLGEERADLRHLLLDLQRLLLQQPQAAKLILQGFIAEGRRFAQTEEGKMWREILARSRFAERGRIVWDGYALDALIASDSCLLPTAWLDIITAAVSDPDLESILSSLMAEKATREDVGSL